MKGRSGGARPGAGRKPKSAETRAAEAAAKVAAQAPVDKPAKPAAPAKVTKAAKVTPRSRASRKRYEDPISYLRDVVNDRSVTDATRVMAARAWAQLENVGRIAPPARPEAKGKKQLQQEAAADTATGTSVFAMRPAPRLVG